MLDLDNMTIPQLRFFIHLFHESKTLRAPVAMHAALLVGYAQLAIRLKETASHHFAAATIRRDLDELYGCLPEEVRW